MNEAERVARRFFFWSKTHAHKSLGYWDVDLHGIKFVHRSHFFPQSWVQDPHKVKWMNFYFLQGEMSIVSHFQDSRTRFQMIRADKRLQTGLHAWGMCTCSTCKQQRVKFWTYCDEGTPLHPRCYFTCMSMLSTERCNLYVILAAQLLTGNKHLSSVCMLEF